MRTATLALLLLTGSATFADSPFISNDVKYKDSGMKPATGRSGDASIEALALLGKDGTTGLEITASGAIDKVQVKLPGDVTKNYTDVSGTTFTQSLTDLPRLAPVGVQVHVGDGTRAAVVSANEWVKLRPDLVVDHASIRPHTAVGAPYDVTAIVREANGDRRARVVRPARRRRRSRPRQQHLGRRGRLRDVSDELPLPRRRHVAGVGRRHRRQPGRL